MKSKLILIASLLGVIALFVCAAIFFGHDQSRVEPLFNETIKALDSEKGLDELFIPAAVEKSESLKEDIAEINKFYAGKSTEIDNFKIYRETNTGYRMSAIVKTDGGEYFISILGSGARLVDAHGISQLVIDDKKVYDEKKLHKMKKYDKYIKKADDFGITVTVNYD